MARILTIEDDSMIAASEKNFLEQRGHIVCIAPNGADGLGRFHKGGIDAVLLNVVLPDMDGFSVCREIRAVSAVPILFVTCCGCDIDQMKGLHVGADDYIVKPVNLPVMAARLETHLAMYRRLTSAEKVDDRPDIQAGDLKIYIKRRQVFRQAREIPLTIKEFDLLCFLAGHPSQVFSKEYLFEKIWRLDACGDLATVTVHINRLREKLNAVKPAFTSIETVWGSGYRFRSDL